MNNSNHLVTGHRSRWRVKPQRYRCRWFAPVRLATLAGAIRVAIVILLLGQHRPVVAEYISDTPIELSPAVEAVEAARTAAIARAMPSATSIFVPGGGGGGSGVVIDPDGFALTNFHVTSPAGNYMQCSLADGTIHDAVIVGIDPVGDLAMIQLLPITPEDDRSNFENPDSAPETKKPTGGKPGDAPEGEKTNGLKQPSAPEPFAAASIGDSRAARPGDWSFVIGNPFLLAGDLQPTVTWGMLSGVGRYQYPSGTLLEYGDCLQTDASINPGNSGGPIYDAAGNVIGIVGRCSFEKRGRVNVGVGYAISIHQAMNFAGTLRAGLIADHATLGATVATDPDGGVRVSNILTGSDAFRRGLRYDSEILRIDGRSVTTANDVQNILATYPARWRIPITFRTDDETIDTVVRLRSVHAEDELLAKMAGASPPPPPVPDKPPEDDDDDNSGPGGKPGEPGDPHGKSHLGNDGELPAAVAERFEARRGFANFHFNRLRQREFIESLRSEPFAAAAVDGRPWTIAGRRDNVPVQIVVSAETATLSVDGNETTVAASDMGDRIESAISDQSEIALLGPLSALYRMIRLGPDRFGDTRAAGTGPLAGMRPLRPITRGIDGAAEVQFYNHPDHGRLEVVEMAMDRDLDPAELWIDRAGGDDAVSGLRLRFGTDNRNVIEVQSWK